VPIAEKLRNRTDEETLTTQIAIEGVLMLQAGVNPRIIERKLNSFLPPQQRVSYYNEIMKRQRGGGQQPA
jgi:chemotaxis protein MotA